MQYDLPDGRRIYILAEGRLVNLAAGDGHPAEIMDMSFAIQALSARYLADNREILRCAQDDNKGALVDRSMLLKVPESIDRAVALRKLDSWGVTIDKLTEKQKIYLYGK